MAKKTAQAKVTKKYGGRSSTRWIKKYNEKGTYEKLRFQLKLKNEPCEIQDSQYIMSS